MNRLERFVHFVDRKILMMDFVDRLSVHHDRLQSFRDRNPRFVWLWAFCAALIGVGLEFLTGYDAMLPSLKLLAIGAVIGLPVALAIAFVVTLLRWFFYRARAIFRRLDALN